MSIPPKTNKRRSSAPFVPEGYMHSNIKKDAPQRGVNEDTMGLQEEVLEKIPLPASIPEKLSIKVKISQPLLRR
jgi:hypothetical protein